MTADLSPAQFPAQDLAARTADYAVDGVRPSIVARPGSQDEVAEVMQVVRERGAAVIPWGGGTHMALAAPPERYDVALDLRGLHRIVEYEPADLTVTVETGMAFVELQRVLGEQGQWLPLDPPCAAEATVGGVLAVNASGPARHSRGTARDLVIGMSFVTAEGALVKSGGRVVKNVAGYDLAKLQIGALGTLGVITQATFKVSPLPVARSAYEIRGALPEVMSMASRLTDERLAVESLVLLKDGAGSDWTLVVRMAGGEAAVERSVRELKSLAGSATETGDPAWARRLQESSVVVRASVLPMSTTALCEAFASAGASVVAYPGVGIVYGTWDQASPPQAVAALRRSSVEAGGALVVERAPLEFKRAAGVWGEPRGDFALMRRLKAELDPGRNLNPGRFGGGI